MLRRPQPAHGAPPVSPRRRDDGRLARTVARRHDLTPDEAARLTGRTLQALLIQAERIVAARGTDDTSEATGGAVAGRYNSGDPLDEILAGGSREWVADCVADYVAGGDPDTRGFLRRNASRGRSTVDATDEDRRDRIQARLDEARS